MQLLTQDIYNYVLANRRHFNCLRNWSERQIISQIDKSILNESLLVYSEDDEIKGVIIADKPDTKNKNLHVITIMTHSSNALKLFVGRFLELYPNYTLTATRYDKPVIYNTPRLCHLIQTLA